MGYQELIAGMEKYGSSKRDICKHSIGVYPEQVCDNVIIAPWWKPAVMPSLGKAYYLSESEHAAVQVWRVENGNEAYTYIKTGIGAPVLMDVVLGLGVTACKSIVFVGSAGALCHDIGIGDIVIPEYSVCGDGASRYIKNTALPGHDVFGERAYPDTGLLNKVKAAAELVCGENRVRWHRGRNFSIDSIFAQFAHLDEIIGMGCNVIEMETAAAFEAAALGGIPIVALFSISDNALIEKSLVSGRTGTDMEYRKFVREELFPQIIRRLWS